LTFFTIALQLFYEKLNITGWKKLVGYISLFVIVISSVYLIMYKDILSYEILQGNFTGNAQKFAVLIGLATLSPFILPFIKEKDSKQWWNFTLTSVTQAIISGLYSVAIFVGMSLALFAVESFWKFRFFENQYIHLAFFSFVLVLPLHFLHKLYDLAKVQKLIELPKFLFILVKFILTPLIAIYTLILYPYIFSFPFKTEWPANIATWVILALLVMVYVGIALLYGVKEKSEDEKFKKLFVRATTAVTIPTILFWSYSLYLRINAYGMSITRFVLMSIIAWFLAMSITYLVNYKTNIKYFIGSFFVLIFSVYFLPFTSYFWAEKAQTDRLVKVAKEEGTLVNNKIVQGDKAKIDSHYYDMQEMLTYINTNFGLEDLKTSLSQDITNKLEINQYGYSSMMNTQAEFPSDTTNVFFKTQPDNVQSNDNLHIILDTASVSMPTGYTKVIYYEQYNSKINIVDNKVIISGKTFVLNIDKNSTKLYTNPIYMTNYASSGNKYTSDVKIMTFNSSDNKEVLVVTDAFYGIQFEKTEMSLYAISGYVFSK
ncbi:MAG TPA: DUF4153 domain-containing protein, partial [Candidatus Dojkabacteria bacterium]|nr:DUF4153 domain-containing protein [Candidatus Dojkabacteria bacterium]